MKWIGSPVAEIWPFAYVGGIWNPHFGGRGGRRGQRQTDRQTTCDRNTALCTKVHRAVKTVTSVHYHASQKYRPYYDYHHQVHHIHRVIHSHCNRAIDTLPESSSALLPTSLQSKVIVALVVKAHEIFNHVVQVNWSCRMCHKNELVIQPRLACCPSSTLAFNTCDKAGQVDSCKHTNVFE